jgi:hypothetical protein
MTGTFDDYFYIMRFYIYSGVCCVDYCSIFLIVLESLSLRFLISVRMFEIPESLPTRDWAGRRTMGSITS